MATAEARPRWSRKTPRGYVRMQYTQAGNGGAAKFHVPAPIARLVTPDTLFRVELNEDGILFRYVEGQEPVPLPKWMT